MNMQDTTFATIGSRPALDKALEQAMKGGAPVALALMDIDRFLEINNTFGYEAGDRVLLALEELLREPADATPFRLSGDEFVLLLPGRTLEQAFLQMEAFRVRVEQAAPQFAVPDGRAVTVTIGVAQYPRDAKSGQDLLQAAAAALYAAKESARNCVALPPNEEMVMKSCYYPASSIRKLKTLGERLGRKDSQLLREALDDLFRKYDTPRG